MLIVGVKDSQSFIYFFLDKPNETNQTQLIK
jgi:hypothetical protein